MSNKTQFTAVIERTKEILDIASDYALAEKLGMSRAAFCNRKTAGSLPYKELIALATANGLCLNSIFYGESAGENTVQTPPAKTAQTNFQATINGVTITVTSHA